MAKTTPPREKELWERVYARLADVVFAEIFTHNRRSDDPVVRGIMDAMLLIADRHQEEIECLRQS